jgi:MraZ protein
MLLTGTFPRLIDDKGRVAIPKPLRDCLTPLADQPVALYVAPGTDGSLSIFPETTFTQQGERLRQLSPNARDVRDYSRLFYAQAVRVELDKQGRVRLPAELVQLAGLNREAVLLGVQDRLELWDRERWQDYLGQKLAQYDEIAEAAFAGGSGGQRASSGTEAEAAARLPR